MDAVKLSKAIAVRMKAAREKANLSQAQLGSILGMTRGGVANIEAGGQRVLIEHVYNTASACGVTVASLLP